MGRHSLSQNGRLVKPTSEMIFDFLKRRFAPFGISKSYLFTIKVTVSDLDSSNRTNRQITLYFKGYAYNECPLNDGYLCP